MPLSTISKHKPPIALTMGDPAGVGPCAAALAWRCRKERGLPAFVFIGAGDALNAHDPDVPIKEVASPEEGKKAFDHFLPVLSVPLKAKPSPGIPDPRNARAVIRALDLALKEVRSDSVSAIVTGPVSKAGLLEAGFAHAGHTGYFAAAAGCTPVMMLANRQLSTVPVTVHVPLKEAVKKLTKNLIVETGTILARELKERFRIANPRLAVTGLNPHAGEEGKLGGEEIKTIIPAIAELRGLGVDAHGPLPADTAFTEGNRMKYDAFLAMTHDQALIPVKTLDFRSTVNITLGLPFVRTSPAHGTAFDLLCEGRSPDPESMIQAILMADRLSS